MEHYPLFKKEYLEEVENHLFTHFLSFTDNLVNQIQFHSSMKAEIPLTFYPIAKNIRIPASHMALNILNHRASFIENKARDGEVGFWREHKQMGDWFPWLWARERIAGNFTNKEGWALYFDSFTEQEKPIEPSVEPLEPPSNVLLFFTYLSCSKYVFQLNDVYKAKMNEYREEMKWPQMKWPQMKSTQMKSPQTKILAVQIRRGETCTTDGSMTDRPFFHLTNYIEAIEKIIHQYEYIYVSTDSDEEIDELKRQRPEWKLLYLPIDRSQFFRMKEKPVDLEVFCCMEPNRIPFIVDSGLADLYFISQCQGYVSTLSISEFSRCGWFLQIATQGKITPYINMNDEPLNMESRDKLLLI